MEVVTANIELRPFGQVVKSKERSYNGLELIAHQRNAKGCFFNRGRHQKENYMTRWLRKQKEEDHYDDFAHVQIQIVLSDDVQTRNRKIYDACTELVAELPSSFREDIRNDAELLGRMLNRLCPQVQWLTFRIEIVQFNACWRWHQDAYVGRAIISYVGPGTCIAKDVHVNWNKFEETLREETNDICVRSDRVIQMETNSVLLMKGDSWPGIKGTGLTHKSPDAYDSLPPKRLLLKVDLNEAQIPLSDDDEYDDDESDADTEEENSGCEERAYTSSMSGRNKDGRMLVSSTPLRRSCRLKSLKKRKTSK